MLFKPFPRTRKELDLLTGVAPVFRSEKGIAKVSGLPPRLAVLQVAG